MTKPPGDQSIPVPYGLASQDDIEEQVLQGPLAYSDFNSTDGREEEEDKAEAVQERASSLRSPDLVLRTKSFHSNLNLLQHTGLSRNEYTSIWTRVGSTSECSELSLREALHGRGDRKTYTYTKPIATLQTTHGESKRVVHQSDLPRHSGILGVTRIPTQLADLEVIIQLGYSFIMEKDRFEIAHALSQEAIDEIVDKTDKLRASSAQQQREDWKLTTLTVTAIIHHGPALEHNRKVTSLRTAGSRALRESAVAPLASSHPGEMRTQMEGLTSINSHPIRRIPNSRSLAGTSISGFHTSRSIMSKTSYKTAPGEPDGSELALKRLQEHSQYAKMLRSRDLWPVDPCTEQDWSGRGQHAEFTKSEYSLINDILQVQGVLGSTAGTVVESVRCRRILLARKTIICNRKFTKEQAIEEVAHINRLKHAHILRVIGTYVVGKSLSILLYPVARYNLEEYLETIISASAGRRQWIAMVSSCRTFFACLSDTICYIHSTFTKHLDIKPHNILIRKQLKPSWSILEYPYAFTIYVADFGVSRSYPREDLIETDGQVCFTRKYAAPEVVSLDKRGLPADIFSLGCVFLEMYIALCDVSSGIAFFDNLADLQNSDAGYDKLRQLWREDQLETTHSRRLHKRIEMSSSGNSYQANLDMLGEHYLTITENAPQLDTTPRAQNPQTDFTGALRLIIAAMMSPLPRDRPTAAALRRTFLKNVCCGKGPCQLEAMANDSDEDDDSDEG